MKPLVVPAVDPGREMRTYLAAALLARGETVTVGRGVPSTWTPTAPRHVQVDWDSTNTNDYPVLYRATVRATVWSASPTASNALAGLVEGLLLQHPGGGGIAGVRPGTGVLTARDPDTSAELASISVQVRVHGTQL